MKNKTNNKLQKNKPFIILAVVISLIILGLGFNSLFTVAQKSVDKQNFINLNSQLDIIQNRFNDVDDSIKWTRQTGCQEDGSGPWPSGKYYCQNNLYTELKTNSVSEIKRVYEKYHDIIIGDAKFEPKTELIYQPANYLDKLVVGSIYQDYAKKDSNIVCRYQIQTLKSGFDESDTENSYGSLITDNKANLSVSFSCNAVALGDWY